MPPDLGENIKYIMPENCTENVILAQVSNFPISMSTEIKAEEKMYTICPSIGKPLVWILWKLEVPSESCRHKIEQGNKVQNEIIPKFGKKSNIYPSMLFWANKYSYILGETFP